MEADRHFNETYRAIIYGWARTESSESAGRRSSAVWDSDRSSSRSSSTRPPGPTCPAGGDLADGGADLQKYGNDEQKSSCRQFSPVMCISPSAIPSPRPVRISHLCGRRQCGTVTNTSSTVRRSSPPVATTPTTSGSPAGPIRKPPKHSGISILIVDTNDPGYSWTPIILSDGGAHHTNATYYNDVRVPADMVVGEVNAGWRLITTSPNPTSG